MIFAEKLTLFIFFKAAFSRKQLFYGTKSIAVRIAEELLVRLHMTNNAMKIDFGNVAIATDIRKNAYLTAQDQLEKIQCKKWTEDMSQLFSINFNLITKKFFFDELYIKYEFFELAMRYAIENPNKPHTIYMQKLFSEPYSEKLRNYFKISTLKQFERINFFSMLFLLPFLLMYYWRNNGTSESLKFNNNIVCCIDGESTYEMYNNLLGEYPETHYVIERHNLKEFSNKRLQELKIHILGMTKQSYLYLKKYLYSYIALCLKHSRDISKYGSRLFWLFYSVIRGKAESIHGKGNFFFTYEHLVTVKAIRNEFIRLEGNKSIFLPKNAHASPQYFHSEIFINYDVMCSAGRHIEQLYHKKKAETKVFLPSGSYDNHRRSVTLRNKKERIARLQAFKGNSLAVTILSPGICDPTYSHEIKLMKLAQKLSRQSGIKLFIRLKPVPLIPKYANFYTPFVEGEDSMMLTGAEYELFDFIEVTDLFITSISNAACDIAMCGGQVMFVDFMKTPDLFLFWTVVNDILLEEESAFEKIMNWINDSEDGRVRTRHKEVMHRLTEYIGYKFSDFESYKTNLINQLRKHVFSNNPAFKDIKVLALEHRE